jgi:hypothetical protein
MIVIISESRIYSGQACLRMTRRNFISRQIHPLMPDHDVLHTDSRSRQSRFPAADPRRNFNVPGYARWHRRGSRWRHGSSASRDRVQAFARGARPHGQSCEFISLYYGAMIDSFSVFLLPSFKTRIGTRSENRPPSADGCRVRRHANSPAASPCTFPDSASNTGWL